MPVLIGRNTFQKTASPQSSPLKKSFHGLLFVNIPNNCKHTIYKHTKYAVTSIDDFSSNRVFSRVMNLTVPNRWSILILLSLHGSDFSSAYFYRLSDVWWVFSMNCQLFGQFKKFSKMFQVSSNIFILPSSYTRCTQLFSGKNFIPVVFNFGVMTPRGVVNHFWRGRE